MIFQSAEEELARMFDALDTKLIQVDEKLAAIQEALRQHDTRLSALEAAPTPDPTPDPAPIGGIWASPQEIMARPTSGPAWDRLYNMAHSDWGEADLSDNNSEHDVHVLAGALAAVRLNDATLREKVIKGLWSAVASDTSRALQLSRGLQSYIIAADLIGFHDPEFEIWLADVITDPDIQGHSGNGVIGTAVHSPNNWGGMARASLATAAMYLNQYDWKMLVVKAQKEMLGLPVEDPQFVYQQTSWHADPNNKAGINRQGATINGVHVSGVLPEDWRRGGNFAWPPTSSGYMWEGIQGLVVTGVILHRAGLLSFNVGDRPIERAFNMLYGRGEAAGNKPVYTFPASGDDRWLPWVVNKYAGTNFPTDPDEQPGKGMGFAEWLYGPDSGVGND